MKYLAILNSCLSFLVVGNAAWAGDVEYGAYLAAECSSCHQSGGNEETQIPTIAGMEEESFIAVMQAYKSKQLENVAMQTIASGLDDEQLAALAAYLATLPSE